MKKKITGKWIQVIAMLGSAAVIGGCAATDTVQPTPESSQEEPSKAPETEDNPVDALKPPTVDFPTDDYDNWNQLMDDNRISESFQEALNQFAFQSGSQVLSADSGNINFSPLSLYYALALAGCGAEGETAVQITESLGVDNKEQLAEQSRKLYQWLYYFGERQKSFYEEEGGSYESALQIGNSLWISEQLPLKEDYRELSSTQFFAPSYQVDFTTPEAGDEIGRWINEQTNGVLTPSIQLDPDTMMAIVNTLYFYGGWTERFSLLETAEDEFTKADGSTVTVPFMNRTDPMEGFYKGDGFTVSGLRTNNNCRMLFLLPDRDRSVEEFLKTPEDLEAALRIESEQWQRGEVVWKVPKFSFGSSMDLIGLLKQMGMEKMSLPEQAEFNGISELPLFVSKVLQETHISIDEKGVEGAAYTMLAMEASAAPMEEEQRAEMILDRPFIYGIQEESTGAWLFLGVCRDPAEIN